MSADPQGGTPAEGHIGSAEAELAALIRQVLEKGEYGLTLKTGESLVIHGEQGSRTVEGTSPAPADLLSLVRQLANSRQMREFRERGVISFIHTHETGARLLVGARMTENGIRVELRRMAS